MRTLVIADHDHKCLKPATRNVVAAAMKLSAPIDLLVAGKDCRAVAEAAARLTGVDRVLVVDADHFHALSPENLAAQVISMASSYKNILTSASSVGKNAMPRIAALLDVAQISEIQEIVAPDTFVRPIYAGNILSTVKSGDAVLILTVRPTAFEPVGDEGSAKLEDVAAVPDTGLSRVIDQQLSVSERPELTSAKVVVSGGRALGSAENFKIIEQLADQMNAAVGASRAAVDAGYVSNDYQVGQTGKIVAPELYVAIGISGAIQHLAGMKDSKVIVAINKDPDAAIFQVADYGLVADLFDAVPALMKELAK